jgi:hypothetical protein
VDGLIEKSGGKRQIDTMKERIETVVDDVFSVLLLGLPQGMLFGMVWIVYTLWAALNMRRVLRVSPSSA